MQTGFGYKKRKKVLSFSHRARARSLTSLQLTNEDCGLAPARKSAPALWEGAAAAAFEITIIIKNSAFPSSPSSFP